MVSATSTIGGSIGGNSINHILYADDLCIVSLFSAGLQQLLVQCDDYCKKKHSITSNVSKSVCMFFKSEVNKKCDNTDIFLSGKAIDFVQETKFIGVILNSQLKTSVDVSRQTRKLYAQANRVVVKYSTCTWYLYLSTYLSVLDVLEYLVYGNAKVLVLVLVLDQKVLGTYK